MGVIMNCLRVIIMNQKFYECVKLKWKITCNLWPNFLNEQEKVIQLFIK